MVKKKSLICLLFLALMIGLSACTINKPAIPANNIDIGQSNGNNNGIVLYYSNTCPHCKVVDEFINSNGIKDKLDFVNKEVSENQANADDLVAKATKCGVKQAEIGVPFLWDGSKCIIGQDDIINFFKTKTNVQ